MFTFYERKCIVNRTLSVPVRCMHLYIYLKYILYYIETSVSILFVVSRLSDIQMCGFHALQHKMQNLMHEKFLF